MGLKDFLSVLPFLCVQPRISRSAFLWALSGNHTYDLKPLLYVDALALIEPSLSNGFGKEAPKFLKIQINLNFRHSHDAVYMYRTMS